MYNLIEYSSNYFGATWNLWFYSKDEATNFNVDIAKNNDFKYLEYKAKLLGKTVASAAPNHNNRILKNATSAVLFLEIHQNAIDLLQSRINT